MLDVAEKLRLVEKLQLLECHWHIELSENKVYNNKLYDNNLVSELVENRSF